MIKIPKNSWLFPAVIGLLISALPPAANGRASKSVDSGKTPPSTALATPNYCIAEHNVGRILLGVTNYGVVGSGPGFILGPGNDCFTGQRVASCEYPKGSRTNYLYSAAFWIGAVVGRDTLVSMGADGWLNRQSLHPDEGSFGQMEYRSIMDPSRPESKGAVSEQDYIGVYTDTFTAGVPGMSQDEITGASHMPLGIEITQRSFAWSYPYAEDFVLFDYGIKNIGHDVLKRVYMGIYVDADVNLNNGSGEGFDDDICGFLETMNTSYGGGNWIDTVNVAWIADNDGELEAGGQNQPLPHVTATRIVRTPSDSLQVSFNWWVSNGAASLDFGPQHKNTVRDLSTGGMGTPAGVRNKYAFLKNHEFDYDQVYTWSIQPTDPLWAYPNSTISQDISDGFDTRYLLSFGPFNLEPGQTLPLSFAYLGGENLHVDPANMRLNLRNHYDPDMYYENLDFTDLATNAVWASWIYDNPGVDSDSDGYAGEFRLVCLDSAVVVIEIIQPDPLVLDTIWEYSICDTVWYQGDGVPDFRGASPPPAPKSWVMPETGRVRVRWNGVRSQTTRDVFSRNFDFEGYRVYLALDDSESSYSMLTSYDIRDFNKWAYNAAREEWQLLDVPFTEEALRCLYGESCSDFDFNPSRFTLTFPYLMPGFPDSIFYFEPQDHNRSELGISTPIEKTYPDQPYPSSLNPDSVEATELTDDGYLKYFEYFYVIENLLPTVPYYINVTAFDYGSPQSGLGALESARTLNAHLVYPQPTVQAVERDKLSVYVYPNPYVGDGTYARRGFEGRDDPNFSADDPGSTDHIRRLHFANLPAKCTIRIFSIDGDLIREFEHDIDPSDPAASHDKWDLITRNTQMVVSGIYYWSVEESDGHVQLGKFVIIM